MKNLIVAALFSLCASSVVKAHDQDIDYILAAIKATPCSEVQVLIAKNVGAIYWDRGSLRYLYADDLEALRTATLASEKRVISVDRALEIPDPTKAGWGDVYDRFVKGIEEIFALDYAHHPPNGC